jgi:rhodanese-related sulfurtransferase
MWIPHDEMNERYDEIPKDCPVIIHCGAGIVSVDAYKILQEKRKDIPELSYIAGAPSIEQYNNWYKENNE